MLIPRQRDIAEISQLLGLFLVVALPGARQCGKTTLAQQFSFDHYFDLESPRDLARLDQPQLTLENLEGLIIIDEMQRAPHLFTLLRHLLDTKPKQSYLLLGSASPNLTKHTSETLAGRIGYYQLGGFGLSDVKMENANALWLRGGYQVIPI